MSDLKKILKEEYDKKKLNITPKLLMEMIEQVMLAEKVNQGNVLEGILVAAFGAMFNKTLSSPPAKKLESGLNQIKDSDVLDMLVKMSGSGDTIEYSKEYKIGDRITKILSLEIGLKEDEIRELKNIPGSDKLEKKYKDEISSCRKYVNDNRFRNLARRFAIDPNSDEFKVKTVGKEQNREDTADVVFLIDDVEIVTLPISVKKDNTLQIAQALTSFSGKGTEAENFVAGIERKFGFLFSGVPDSFETFKNEVESLFAPISGCSAVSAASREELYLNVDTALKKCDIENVDNAEQFIIKLKNSFTKLLSDAADYFNNNPDEFSKIVLPLVAVAVGSPELFKSAKRGKDPKVARINTLTKNLSKQARFGVESDEESAKAFFTVGDDKIPLFQFRFRRDAASGKNKKFMIRLYLESTEMLYDLLKFGRKATQE